MSGCFAQHHVHCPRRSKGHPCPCRYDTRSAALFQRNLFPVQRLLFYLPITISIDKDEETSAGFAAWAWYKSEVSGWLVIMHADIHKYINVVD